MSEFGTKGVRTKNLILDTMATMFWRQNYGGTSVDDIVNAAGVNKASFYRYFKNKERAGIEGIQHLALLTREHVFDASFSEHQHPTKRLESIFKKIYQTHGSIKRSEKKVPGCPFINFGNELATTNEGIGKEVEKIFQGFQKYFETIYKEAIELKLTTSTEPAKDVAKQVQGVLNGAMVRAKLCNRPKEIIDAFPSAKLVMGLK